jgi:hypothetical protein
VPDGLFLARIRRLDRRVPERDWAVPSGLAERLQGRDLHEQGGTQKGCFELWDDKGKWLVLDFHLGEEGGYFWDEIEVIFE